MFKKTEIVLASDKTRYCASAFDAPSLRTPLRPTVGSPAGAVSRKGAILLEIVLAMAIFVFSAAVVQSGLVSCLRSLDTVRLQNQAVNLGVTKLSEIHMGLLDVAGTELTSFEEEDESLSEWGWQITAEPIDEDADVPSVTLVTVTITNTSRGITYQLTEIMSSPQQQGELSIRGTAGSFFGVRP